MAKWIRFKRRNSSSVEFGKLADDDSPVQGEVTVYEGNMFDGAESTHQQLDVRELELLTPCRPGKMIGLWNNVRGAAEKKGLPIPEEPLYFFKTSNSYLAHEGTIERPDHYDGRIIYEGELGVVIGKTCRNVSAAGAADVIFGYTCVNDITALTLIDKDPTFAQWCRAKSMDTFGAFGPSIRTGIDPGKLTVKTLYRNKVMQDYPVTDLIFSPYQLVSLLSREMTLHPGDLIACGTDDGILPIRPGASVEIRIDGLDTLRNTMSPD